MRRRLCATLSGTLMLGLAVPLAAQDRIVPGTVVVEAPEDEAGTPASQKAFVEAAIGALGDAGFTPLPGRGPARYVARVRVAREARGTVTTAGGGSDVAAFPGGIAIGFGGGKRIGGLTRTELSIAVTLRDGSRPVWTGTAITVQADGTDAAQPARIAPRLAGAAMSGFPYQRSEPASVP